MHEPASIRRLLMVEPCDECLRLIPGLRTVGWEVTNSTLESAATQPCDVGLVCLRPQHLEQPQVIEDLISRSQAEWIALLSADDLRREVIGDFVCEWFSDFHTLPVDVARVQLAIGRAYGVARLRAQGTPCSTGPGRQMLGESRPARELRRLLSKLAPTELPVLIRGEAGTGKEMVARTLHQHSQRSAQPFVSINCGAVPEHQLQAQLFGSDTQGLQGSLQRQPGKIEAAHGGTLFLDDISHLPLDVQANLLRFLQDRLVDTGSQRIAVDVRILAATHVNLEAAIRTRHFREDLYYRLNVLQVGMAPLRERLGDLTLLANHFTHFYSQETGRRPRSFSQDALVAMGKHGWPGNVRELKNRVRRAQVLAEGRQIEAFDLGLLGEADISSSIGTLDEYKRRAEHQALCDVLTRHSDNLSVAAKVLGISRPTFYRLLHKHQIR